LLRFIRQGQRWFVGGVILFVGAVFVFFIGLGGPLGPGSAGAVVEVDGLRFDSRDHARVREQQEQYYRETLGDAFDAVGVADQLDSIAANALIQRAILANEAEMLGLRVSQDEMASVVRRGFPDAEQYKSYVRYEFGTERSYLRALRTDLLVQKMVHLLDQSVSVSEREARDSLLHQKEEIRLAIVSIDSAEPPAELEIPDEQVAEFVVAQPERLAREYEQRSDRYQQPEQARARHILIKVEPDAEPELEQAARERAEQVLERLRGGEDFAAVAAEVSEDTGSKDKGGDLGFFGRDQMVKPFEDAAFSLEPGVLSEPVRSPFGFHILRVEERTEEQTRALQDVQEELAREILAQEAAEQWALETANRLAAAIREGKGSLEEIAREEGLEIQRTGLLRRRADGFVPGFGASPELLAAGFALRIEAPSSDRVFTANTKRALIQLLERQTPDEAEIEEALSAELERLREAKRSDLQSRWIEARRSDLQRDGKLYVNLAVLRGL
jgi:peptidyl-prolyl cis-trans isomerase D